MLPKEKGEAVWQETDLADPRIGSPKAQIAPDKKIQG